MRLLVASWMILVLPSSWNAVLGEGIPAHPAEKALASPPPDRPAGDVGRYDPEDPRANADGMVWGAKETPAKPSATESPKSSSPDAISPGSVPAATPSPAAAPDAPKTGYLAQYYRKTDRSGTVENPGRGSLTSIFFQMLGGLALVLGIAILGAALLKRASNKGFFGNRGRFWKVVEVVPLGPKRNLYVTQFVDRVVLLGATDQQITVLAEIHDPALALAIESGQTDFRRFLVPEAMENWANSSEGLEAEGTSEPAPAEGKTSARPPARKRTPESSPAPSFHRSTTL